MSRLTVLLAAAQSASGAVSCLFTRGTATSADIIRGEAAVGERLIVLQVYGAPLDPTFLDSADGVRSARAAFTGSWGGVDTAWDSVRHELLPNDTNFGFESSAANGTADIEYDTLVLNITAVPRYRAPGTEFVDAVLPGGLLFDRVQNLTCENRWEIVPAAVPDAWCEFVGGTATSALAVRDAARAERTIVIRVWGAEFDPDAAASSQAIFDAMVGGIVGSHGGAPGTWDAVKSLALPGADSVGFAETPRPAAGNDTDSPRYDLLVLNLTAVPAYNPSGPEWLNATIPGLMMTGAWDYNMTCRNAWRILPLSAEQAALFDLYDSLGGEVWSNSDRWLDSTYDLCVWEGISCEVTDRGEFGDVRGIYLTANNLQGSIPAAISTFTTLVSLHLEANSINGTIPDGIAGMVDLEEVSLAENELTGTIPWQWEALPKLRQVLLYRNKLTGTVPVGWGNLTNITTVLLQENDLEGTLPPWGFPGDPSRPATLRKVWAYGNPRFQERNPTNDQTSWEDARYPHSLAKHSCASTGC